MMMMMMRRRRRRRRRRTDMIRICEGTLVLVRVQPCLYLICAEIMSILIRQNVKIKGIKLNEVEVLLSQFADDTTVCLDGTEESFNECMRMLQLFSDVSGLKINKDKTIVVWLGSKKILMNGF
jgi:hypothetical protein